MDPRTLGCDCDNCPLQGAPVIFPKLNKKAKLIVVGEAPGPDEEQFGAYFVGETGRFFDEVLDYLVISRANLHVTNTCMCRPRRTPSPAEWRKAIECCGPRLHKELAAVQSDTILTYGKVPLFALCGPPPTEGKGKKKLRSIFDWAGAPLSAPVLDRTFTVLPTLHPAFALRPQGWAYRPDIYIHTARAWEIARGKLGQWTWPRILVEPDEDALDALRRMARTRLPVGFDVETRGVNPLADLCMCVGLATEEVAVSVPWERYVARAGIVSPGIAETEVGRDIKMLVKTILEDRRIPKIFQNGPHDILTARRLGINVEPFTFDTMLAHAIVAQGRRHDLGWICCEEFHAPRWKEEKHTASNEKGADKFSRRDPVELRTYNAKDAYMTVRLHAPLSERLDDEPHGWELFQSYMDNTHVAMKMKIRGFKISTERRVAHRVPLKRRRLYARWMLRQIARRFWPDKGKRLNPRSKAQMEALFFRKLKVIPKRFSEKTERPTLDEQALSDLVGHHNRWVSYAARLALRYRKWDKLLTTYVDGLPVDQDGVVHSTFKPAGARTMRWSSSPNLQNIPPAMRDMFVAHDPDAWLVRADYDQLELKIIALLAGDEPLIQAFNAGKDPHRLNAADLFGHGEDLAAVSDEERKTAKVAVYQMNYGGDPVALWKKLQIDWPDITLTQCQSMHNRWFFRHGAIAEWHSKQVRQGQENRYIEAPISGHRLYFFGRVEESKLYNYPVQHSAADIFNPAIPPISRALNWTTESIVAQVHDELVTEGLDPLKLAELLVKHMTRTVTLNGQKLTFTVSLKIGRDWASYQEIPTAGRPLPEILKDVAKLCGLPSPGSKKRGRWGTKKVVSAMGA